MLVFMHFQEDDANHMAVHITDLNQKIYKTAVPITVTPCALEVNHVLRFEIESCIFQNLSDAIFLNFPSGLTLSGMIEK